jgi:hypothetical protein
MAAHPPHYYKFSTPTYVFLYALLLFVHWGFDSSMAQKSRFRMGLQGTLKVRWTFPQWPWSTLQDPRYLQTEHGNALLIDGWWQFVSAVQAVRGGGTADAPHRRARSTTPSSACCGASCARRVLTALPQLDAVAHMGPHCRHQLGDPVLVRDAGGAAHATRLTPSPRSYPLFFLAVLTHRCGRDFERVSGSVCAASAAG